MSEPNWYNVAIAIENGKVAKAKFVDQRNRVMQPIPLDDMRAIVEWASAEVITPDIVQDDGTVHLQVVGADPEQPTKRKPGRPRKASQA